MGNPGAAPRFAFSAAFRVTEIHARAGARTNKNPGWAGVVNSGPMEVDQAVVLGFGPQVRTGPTSTCTKLDRP